MAGARSPVERGEVGRRHRQSQGGLTLRFAPSGVQRLAIVVVALALLAPEALARTIRVPEDASTMRAALLEARPGDTILIRHRGPLDIPPIDPTGKSPLTSAGDSLHGVEYSPLGGERLCPDGTRQQDVETTRTQFVPVVHASGITVIGED